MHIKRPSYVAYVPLSTNATLPPISQVLSQTGHLGSMDKLTGPRAPLDIIHTRPVEVAG